ncbi:MAG: AhpC/TSA family protein [Acidobacteria bacterium]|nr:AhpC/TSA family protein [Acidobacteriota bacterium]
MKWRSLDESRPTSQIRPLRETYAERKQLIARLVPPEIQALHRRAVEELRESGIAHRALRKGSRVEGFALPDHQGRTLSSSQLVAKSRLVLCFFRGRWCPFCVGQLEAMDRHLEFFEEVEASVVGISPQSVRHSFFMADQHRLRFPLLSDPTNSVARQFGLVYSVPQYQQAIYRQTFVDLPAISGEPDWELPIPAVYVLDRGEEADSRSHRILYAACNPDYSDRPEPQEILDFLKWHQP